MPRVRDLLTWTIFRRSAGVETAWIRRDPVWAAPRLIPIPDAVNELKPEPDSIGFLVPQIDEVREIK